MQIDGAIQTMRKIHSSGSAHVIYLWVISDQFTDIDKVCDILPRDIRSYVKIKFVHQSDLPVLTTIIQVDLKYPDIIEPNRQYLDSGFTTVQLLCRSKMFVQAKDLLSFLILYIYGGYFLDANVTPLPEFDSSKFSLPTKLRVSCEPPKKTQKGYLLKKTMMSDTNFVKYTPFSQLFKKHDDDIRDFYLFPRIDLWFVCSPPTCHLLLRTIIIFTTRFAMILPFPDTTVISYFKSLRFFEGALKRWQQILFQFICTQKFESVFVTEYIHHMRKANLMKYPLVSDNINGNENRGTLNKLLHMSEENKEKLYFSIFNYLNNAKTISVLRSSKFLRRELGLSISWSSVIQSLLEKYNFFGQNSQPLNDKTTHSQATDYIYNTTYKILLSDGVVVESFTDRNNKTILLMGEYGLKKTHGQSWL